MSLERERLSPERERLSPERKRLSLFARVALILAAGLFVTLAASLWLHWDERTAIVAQARGQHIVDRLADTVRLLEAETPSRREAAMRALESADLRIAPITEHEIFPLAPRGQIHAALATRLGQARELRSVSGAGMGPGAAARRHNALPGQVARQIDVRLADGQWVRLSFALDSGTPALPTALLAQLLVSLAIVGAVAVLAMRQAIRPLRQFAQAADALGVTLDAPPLSENGPSETRQAAQAFNRMQQRIRQLIDERSRALAAVSHDLRTPLTRLRLRAELVEDDALRGQLSADIDAMAGLLDDTLNYLRGLEENEALHPIDIDALVHSLVADTAVLGHAIVVTGAACAPFTGRLNALRRALQNLIDNATRHARHVTLRIEDDAVALRLCVADDGPGIAARELPRVTAPYYRPDEARANSGAAGLGLAIVKDIAQRHGGELHLANRPEGGLEATLVLPRAVR